MPPLSSSKPVPKAVDKSRDKSATARLDWRGGVCLKNEHIRWNWSVPKYDNKPSQCGLFAVKRVCTGFDGGEPRTYTFLWEANNYEICIISHKAAPARFRQ